MTPDRRTFLTQAGLAALAVGTSTLAGCAASGPSRVSGPSMAAGPSRAPSPGGGPVAQPPTPEAPITLKASQVPVGGGTILATVVVTQPRAGEFKAFTRTCTHQSCPVSDIRGDRIHCDCHGSEYSITDGSVLKGPASRALPEFPVTESGDELTITPA